MMRRVLTSEDYPLLTDLYEFTMLHAYRRDGLNETAVFDLFVRRLPEKRNFLLAAGLDDALAFLESFAFTPEQIAWLEQLPPFRGQDLRYLKNFRFTGKVRAVPEGTPVFPNEPILEVEAPLGEAQIVETFLLNQVTFQTLAASKAVRVVRAAGDAAVVDFGLRRMHGVDAGMKAARAFFLAGVTATSNVAAGRAYGIPVSGTMAHSYIQAHGEEAVAFRRFAETYPETVLLVDTYDTLAGVRRVVELARELGETFRVRAIRLDSGDPAELAPQARRILDEAGLSRVGIFASNHLDEYRIARLRTAGAPIDGYGVGTAMGVSDDAPALDSVYKLVEYGGEGRIKLSSGKGTLPGRKQVYRMFRDGRAGYDVLARAGEEHPGTPLLREVMRGGKRLEAGNVPLETARAHARGQVETLPGALRGLDPVPEPYRVELSAALEAERDRIATALARTASGRDPRS